MSLSITEVSRRTGVPSSTLRYYERVGLLPGNRRANGYREFDERALDRLRFIHRAKELGCSLEEIAALLEAFDDDCADVQAPLRQLVDTKIADAQRRVAALVALTAQLQEARHALAVEASSGPCGPTCACSAERSDAVPRTVVPLSTANSAIACTLDYEAMPRRIADWQAALVHVERREALDGGIRLIFGPRSDIAEVVRLARDENACCSFFSFAFSIDDRGTALEVRAPAGAGELVTSIFGIAA
jgi:MerR family copper efflux transcriptional regulator